jgi:hypothetical protein
MAGYFLRHSHLLISLAGVLLGIAISFAFRPIRVHRRPLAYRRYRRLFLPITLTAAIAVAATALFVPSGGYVVAEWKTAVFQGSVWAVTVLAVLVVPSFYRILVALPVLTVIGVSAILWTPLPIVDGKPSGIDGIVVVEEQIESTPRTSTRATIAMLRVRRSLQTQEPEIHVLPTIPLTPLGGTTTPIEGGIDVEAELFAPPFAFWWLPPQGTPLRVRIGDVTLVRYPEESVRARLLTLLEERGITRRRRYNVRYPNEASRFIQSGLLFVEIASDPLSFGTVPTDDW